MIIDQFSSFQSAYAEMIKDGVLEEQREPKYTTWKIREDGEHIETLDYIFYHSPTTSLPLEAHLDNDEDHYMSNKTQNNSPTTPAAQTLINKLQVEKVLDFPTGEQISQDRLPSLSYASDHFSLLAHFKLSSIVSESEE